MENTLEAHTDNISTIIFNHQNDLLATGYHDGTVCIWNTTGSLFKRIENRVSFDTRISAFSHDNFLAFVSYDDIDHTNRIYIWNITSGQLVKELLGDEGHDAQFNAVVFNHTNLFASSAMDGKVRIWRTDSWESVKELHEGNECYCIAFSQDNLFAAGLDDFNALIWNTDTWSLVKELNDHTGSVTSLAFDQSHFLASGSFDDTVKVYNTKTWSLIKELRGDIVDRDDIDNIIKSVNFMQNKTLVAVREDGDILTWNTENWESTNQLKEAEGFREGSRIALDWNNLLAISFESEISVWKEETEQSLNKSNNYKE